MEECVVGDGRCGGRGLGLGLLETDSRREVVDRVGLDDELQYSLEAFEGVKGVVCFGGL